MRGGRGRRRDRAAFPWDDKESPRWKAAYLGKTLKDWGSRGRYPVGGGSLERKNKSEGPESAACLSYWGEREGDQGQLAHSKREVGERWGGQSLSDKGMRADHVECRPF